MSAYNYVIPYQLITPGGTASVMKTLTGDTNLETVIAVAPGATAQTGPLAVVQANMVVLIILFKATGSINGSIGGYCAITTVGTVDTINAYDGIPLIWYAHNGLTNPFTGNITSYSLADDSTGAVGGTLQISVLTNV